MTWNQSLFCECVNKWKKHCTQSHFRYAISRFALTQNAGNAVGNGAANVAVLHVGLLGKLTYELKTCNVTSGLVNNHGEIKTKPLQHSMQAMRARGT